MTRKHGNQKTIVESFPSIKESLYYMYVKPQSDIAVFKTIFSNQESYRIWLDRLGHPGLNMMQRIVKNSNGHNLATKEFPNQEDFLCIACAKGKLITRPSKLKIQAASMSFLERIQGDIC